MASVIWLRISSAVVGAVPGGSGRRPWQKFAPSPRTSTSLNSLRLPASRMARPRSGISAADSLLPVAPRVSRRVTMRRTLSSSTRKASVSIPVPLPTLRPFGSITRRQVRLQCHGSSGRIGGHPAGETAFAVYCGEFSWPVRAGAANLALSGREGCLMGRSVALGWAAAFAVAWGVLGFAGAEAAAPVRPQPAAPARGLIAPAHPAGRPHSRARGGCLGQRR